MSQVDLEDVDTSSFPQFIAADYLEVVLKAGEALLLPASSWHYTRSLEYSCSVGIEIQSSKK